MKHLILLTFGFLFFLSSCISEKSVTRKYYTLELPPEISISSKMTSGSIPGKCEIGRVSIDPLYEKNQIVNRSKSHEVTFYMYHQWAVRPSDAIRSFISDYLNNKRLFESVSERYSRSIPDYVFETNIRDLEVVENGNSFSAHISMEFALVMNSNDSVMVKYEANRIEQLDKKNMNLFAYSVSNVLFEELETFSGLILKLDIPER